MLVLGDSITFGDFVSKEDTLTRRLEALTKGCHRTIRFINAGLPGVGTTEEFYFYTVLKNKVDPDLVLVGMYLNDAVNAGQFYARAIPYPFAKSRFFSWVASRFQILSARLFRPTNLKDIDPNWREAFQGRRNLKSGDMFHDKDAFDFEIYNAYMDFGLGWNPKAWDLIGDMMSVFKKSVDESGRPLAVFLFPVHIQIMGTVQSFEPQDRCRRMCSRLGTPFYDLVPPLRARLASAPRTALVRPLPLHAVRLRRRRQEPSCVARRGAPHPAEMRTAGVTRARPSGRGCCRRPKRSPPCPRRGRTGR